MAPVGRYVFSCVSAVFLFACANGPHDDDVGSTSSEGAGGSGSASSGSGGNPDGAGGTEGAADLFVPADITFRELADQGEGVDVVSATLALGMSGHLELYAALFNNGPSGACSGGMGVELFDVDEQSLGAFDSIMYGSQLYRADELDQVVGCIDPGERGHAAVTDIDPAIDLDDVAHVIYRFTYFSTEFFSGGFTPLTEFTVQDVMRVESAAGSGFSGTLHNGLDASVDEPAVTVFALDAVGRPLATTDVTRAEPLLSGEDWEFLTPPVIDAGQNEVAYALGDVKF